MKFSIRDLLLVTMIVALGFCWWIERQKHTHWEQRALQEGRDIRFLLKHVEPDGIQGYEYQWYLNIKEENVAMELYTEPEAILPLLPNSSAPAPNPPKE